VRVWAVVTTLVAGACGGRAAERGEGAATVVSGLLPAPPEEAVRGRELHLLTVPFAPTPELGDAAIRRIREFVEARSGLRLRVTTYGNYEATGAALEAGEGNAALLSPLLYVRVAERFASEPSLRGVRLRLLATGVAGGSPTYLGYIVAAADGAIRELADVEGRPFGMVQGSTSGYLYPTDLAEARGFDPARLFASVRTYTRHAPILADLLRPAGRRSIEAGALYQHMVDRLGSAERARLRVVAKTARIPRDALVVRVPLADGREDPEALRTAAAFQDAMLAVSTDPATAKALQDGIGYDGWIVGDDRRYDAIRNVYRRFGRYRFGGEEEGGEAEAEAEGE
jgi:ABC-type phosphate/phosphonate transport system substrate-binding protein